MGHKDEDMTEERRRIDHITGSDLPESDGQVSDEDVEGDEAREGKPTGQDHSTERYGEQMPESGVGKIQDDSDTGSDIARIRD